MEEPSATLHPKVVADIIDFANVIAGSDDAARILRLHAATEFLLDRLLALHLKSPKCIIENDRFSYYHKLQLAIAFQAVDSTTVGALRKLTTLRHRCAHSRKPEVGAEELDAIGIVFGASYRDTANDYDGEHRQFRALAYVLFTRLSDQITPREIANEPTCSPSGA